MINNKKISVYTTSRCALSLSYPIEAVIKSALNFCDELVILDSSDKDDGTRDFLQTFVDFDERVQVYHADDVGWNDVNGGVNDGLTKAASRQQCTGDVCVSVDLDEIFEDKFGDKLKTFLERVELKTDMPVVALPVVEPWGSNGKIRMDINPWKERISLNLPHITHGIPKPFKHYINGNLHAYSGTSDGCNLINARTELPIPIVGFVPPNVNQIRQSGLYNEEQRKMYEFWFQTVIDELPTVYHFSWWSIAAKIRKYKEFWNNSWLSLYGEQKPEGWNPFFHKSLNDVSEDEIKELADKLEFETGGHIFHSPWNGQKVNNISITNQLPSFVKEWAENNRD